MNLVTIKIPKDAAVVVLEDSPMRIAWFKKMIPGVVVLSSVAEFQKFFEGQPRTDIIFWDHDLGEGPTGYDAAKWFTEKFGMGSRWMVIHSYNRGGARRMQEFLADAPHIPFGNFDIEVGQ